MLRRLVVVPASLALACLGPAPSSERQAEPVAAPSTAASPAASPTVPIVVSERTPIQRMGEVEPDPTLVPKLDDANPSEPASPTPSEPSEPPSEPAEPAGPEPGSPESDAELLALLDDSTLTQDEFAKAFGNAKAPKIDAEGEFDFGAVERSRVEVGAATARDGKPDLAGVEALAQADLHELEACHAMALRKDDKALGKLVLALAFDGGGKVESVGVTGKLPKSLTDCIASVAKGWSSPKSAGSELELALTLALQPM